MSSGATPAWCPGISACHSTDASCTAHCLGLGSRRTKLIGNRSTHIRILLIGDSQERNLVGDICWLAAGRMASPQLSRFQSGWGPTACHFDDVSVTLVQMPHFGVGPDSMVLRAVMDDGYGVMEDATWAAATHEMPTRLFFLPSIMAEVGGPPTHIVAHTGLWDLRWRCYFVRPRRRHGSLKVAPSTTNGRPTGRTTAAAHNVRIGRSGRSWFS